MNKAFLSAILFSALFPLALLTAQTPAVRTLVVVNEAWPPFRVTDADHRFGFRGIDTDMLELMEAELGVRVSFERHPFARCLEMIKTSKADIITGIAKSAEREAYIRYVPTSYFTVGPVFYTQKGKGALVKTYADLYGKKIGYSLNSVYFEPFNSDIKLTKVGISTELQLIQMLALGRIDLTIGTNPNIAYDIREQGLSDKLEQTLFIPEQKTPIYIGLSERAADLIPRIDAFLATLIKSGRMQTIAAKYR